MLWDYRGDVVVNPILCEGRYYTTGGLHQAYQCVHVHNQKMALYYLPFSFFVANPHPGQDKTGLFHFSRRGDFVVNPILCEGRYYAMRRLHQA